jgi:hypothetical protein
MPQFTKCRYRRRRDVLVHQNIHDDCPAGSIGVTSSSASEAA